jgi:hypothetical protein
MSAREFSQWFGTFGDLALEAHPAAAFAHVFLPLRDELRICLHANAALEVLDRHVGKRSRCRRMTPV